MQYASSISFYLVFICYHQVVRGLSHNWIIANMQKRHPVDVSFNQSINTIPTKRNIPNSKHNRNKQLKTCYSIMIVDDSKSQLLMANFY